jgi:hypothetical protein
MTTFNHLFGFAGSGKSSFLKERHLKGDLVINTSDFMYYMAEYLDNPDIARDKTIKEDASVAQTLREAARQRIIDWIENYLIESYYASRNIFIKECLKWTFEGLDIYDYDDIWFTAFNEHEHKIYSYYLTQNYPNVQHLNWFIIRNGHQPGKDARYCPSKIDFVILTRNGRFDSYAL